MRGVGLAPVAAVEMTEPGPGGFVAGDGLAVAAEAVVLGVGDQAGAHGIEVDIENHRAQGVGPVFDEHGFEAFGEEGAVAFVGLVEPDRETLFEQLHEGGDVEHAGVEGGEVDVFLIKGLSLNH